MLHKKIKYCRNCKSKKIEKIIDLGNQALTGKFPSSKSHSIIKTPLILAICNKCKLVQLYNSLNNTFLYNLHYGYETGINNTMRNHMKQTVKEIMKLKHLKKGNIILDIASNDGTLLNYFRRNLITVGIDPILERFKKI